MPRTREELEQIERQTLAPYAQFSGDTRGRKQVEKAEPIMTNLIVPKTMFDYLAQFEHASAKPVPGI